MFIKLIPITFTLLAASSAIARDCRLQLDGKYLDLTNGGQRVHLGPLELMSMRLALKTLRASDLISGPEAIRMRLAQLDKGESITRGLDARLLVALIEMANPKADCSQELTLKWLKLAAFTQMSGQRDERNSELACYLTRLGARKFTKCARELELKFKANFRADSPMGRLLDEFFIEAMRSQGFHVRDGLDLGEQINRLQVSNSNHDSLVQLAARWADQIARDKLVQEFLRYQSKAAKFMPSGRLLFTQINLARDLGKFSPEDANLNKLNEFHRLVCIGRLRFRDENVRQLCQFVQLQAQLLMLD